MNKTTIDLWVGLFVIAGIAALMFLTLKVGSLDTVNVSNSYVVTANFENIGGLKPRAPVKSAGVVVGRVTEIDNEPYEARVTLRLDKDYVFQGYFSRHHDLRAIGRAIHWPGGGWRQRHAEGGDKIKITQDAVVLENLIGHFFHTEGPRSETRNETNLKTLALAVCSCLFAPLPGQQKPSTCSRRWK